MVFFNAYFCVKLLSLIFVGLANCLSDWHNFDSASPNVWQIIFLLHKTGVGHIFWPRVLIFGMKDP